MSEETKPDSTRRAALRAIQSEFFCSLEEAKELAHQTFGSTAREQAIRECIATIEAMNEINVKRVTTALSALLQSPSTGEETK